MFHDPNVPCREKGELFRVLHQDDDLLVIQKPAGLVCHPTKNGELSSLVGRVRLYLGPDRTMHLVNRLDRETGGVVIVALTDQSARALRRLWEARSVSKEYHALVRGHVPDDHLMIDAPLGKDAASRVAIKDCVREDGSPAQTEVWTLHRFQLGRDCGPVAGKPASLVRLLAHTGRKHQLRIHLAYKGHPIIGDKIYGENEDLYLALVEDRLTDEQRAALLTPHHALHATRLEFTWCERHWCFAANPEPWFLDLLPAGIAAALARFGPAPAIA